MKAHGSLSAHLNMKESILFPKKKKKKKKKLVWFAVSDDPVNSHKVFSRFFFS